MKNNIIEKSVPLIYAEWSNFTTSELKIFELYLSRINARDQNSSKVVFSKEEWCNIFGLKPGSYKNSEIKETVSSFLKKQINIQLDESKGRYGYVLVNLFSMATCSYHPDRNESYIEIECNQDLKDAFFDLVKKDKDGNLLETNHRYITYRLSNTLLLNQKHSIKLYSILKDKSFNKDKKYTTTKVVLQIDDLHRWLGLKGKKSYNEFKEFNRSILKKSQAEINEHTDIFFTYEAIKNGTKTTAIEFTITKKKDKNKNIKFNDFDVLDADFNEKSSQIVDDNEYAESPYSVYHEMLNAVGVSLTDEQIAVLIDLSKPNVEINPYDFVPYDIQVAEYIKLKGRLMRAQTKPVINEFSWLKKACEGDW